MLHLLTETSVFLSLPNGCLCQVTGVPIIFITPTLQGGHKSFSLQPREQDGVTSNKKRPFPSVDQGARPCKRQKLANSTTRKHSVKLSKTTGYAQPVLGVPVN